MGFQACHSSPPTMRPGQPPSVIRSRPANRPRRNRNRARQASRPVTGGTTLSRQARPMIRNKPANRPKGDRNRARQASRPVTGNDPVARGPTGPHHENVRTPDDSSDAGNLVAKLQRALKRLGYRPGLADNKVGKRTFSAIVAYQRRNGLKPNGKASLELLKHMQSIENIGRHQAKEK